MPRQFCGASNLLPFYQTIKRLLHRLVPQPRRGGSEVQVLLNLAHPQRMLFIGTDQGREYETVEGTFTQRSHSRLEPEQRRVKRLPFNISREGSGHADG